MNPLFLRHEYFGSIVYDPNSTKYFNLDNSQTALLKDFTNNNSKAGKDLYASLVGKNNLHLLRNLVEIRNEVSDKKLSAPLKAFFNITKRCNLFCRHCYNDSGREDSPQLHYHDIIDTLKELEKRGIFKVTLAGGEPLFHPDFNRILKFINTTYLSVSLITNGICINKNRAMLLGQSNNLNSITVSLDGVSSRDNDAIRGKGAFSKTMRGLNYITQYFNKSLSVRITITQANMDNVHELPNLLKPLGIKEIKVNSINAYGRAKQATDLLLTQDEYFVARDRLLEAASKHGMSLEVPAHKYQQDKDNQIGLCKSGEETFEIDGDGSVYPCSFAFGHFFAGNVKQTPFDQIFANLQNHNINNQFCYQCKGRGGKCEKIFGQIPKFIHVPEGSLC